MEAIKVTVVVDEKRRVLIDLPDDVPLGPVQLTIHLSSTSSDAIPSDNEMLREEAQSAEEREPALSMVQYPVPQLSDEEYEEEISNQPKRRLKIDMGDLAMAFENSWPEIENYLDLETGRIIIVDDEASSILNRLMDDVDTDNDGEDVLDDWLQKHDVEDWQGEIVKEAYRIETGHEERYIRVECTSSREGYRDMETFIDTVESTQLQNLLQVAIQGKGAFRRFKDVLLNYPEERTRWFDFKDKRLTERVLSWLDDYDVEPIPSTEQD